MNTWLLRRNLSELVARSEQENVRVFAKTLNDNYIYPVDIQVLSPEAEIIMHQPESRLPYDNEEQEYLTILGAATKERS